MADDRDPCSEFQRAFSALGVTHLVAPSPQAKGKIERRFGTLQQRLVALLAYEHVRDYPAAQVVLDRQVAHQNATVCHTTGLSPDAAWTKALMEQRTAMHCHPSGDATPSEADIKVTRDLIRAGQLLKMELCDHVIMGTATADRPGHQSLRALGYFYQ